MIGIVSSGHTDLKTIFFQLIGILRRGILKASVRMVNTP